MQEHSKECYGCSRATAKMPREALHHGRDLLPGTTNGMTHGPGTMDMVPDPKGLDKPLLEMKEKLQEPKDKTQKKELSRMPVKTKIGSQ